MIILLKKFGTILTSRQLGKESFNAFLSTLDAVSKDELVEVDFEGVTTFSPSWGDEFLSPLLEKYGERLMLKNTSNLSVKMTLETLEELDGKKFKIVS